MKLAPRHEVMAVDINPVQLAYAARRFAGGGRTRHRRARHGVRRSLAPLVGWWPSRVRAFLDLDDPSEQIEFWHRHLDTRRFRAAVDGLLSLDRRCARSTRRRSSSFLPPHFGGVMRGRMERCFARHPNRTNPYARALLLGELSDEPPPAGGEGHPPRARRRGGLPRNASPPGASTGSRSRTSSTAPRPATRGGCRRGEARRRAGRDRRAAQLRRGRRRRCRPTAPRTIGRCSGASSTSAGGSTVTTQGAPTHETDGDETTAPRGRPRRALGPAAQPTSIVTRMSLPPRPSGSGTG